MLRLYCIAKKIERRKPHNNKIKLGGTIAKSTMVIMITGVGSSLNLLTVCFIGALIKLTIVLDLMKLLSVRGYLMDTRFT